MSNSYYINHDRCYFCNVIVISYNIKDPKEEVFQITRDSHSRLAGKVGDISICIDCAKSLKEILEGLAKDKIPELA